MTILSWPPDGKPPRPTSPQKSVVEPLPLSVLHSLVADIPGPPNETEAARAIRFEAQLAEVLSYKPRDVIEAMLAVQCVLMRLMTAGTFREPTRAGQSSSTVRKLLRIDKQFHELLDQHDQYLASRQACRPAKFDPELFRSHGSTAFLEPNRDAARDDFNDAEEAVSAIIIPMHPAPKMLQ